MLEVSVVVTVLNEERSIGALLDSLLSQSQPADEIVVVDGGSSDKTLAIIKEYQSRGRIVKLVEGKCSRSQGRNIGVKAAKNSIIAMIDADCVAQRDWLEKISKPFLEKNVEMVAGFYKMVTRSPYAKAASVFLGVSPQKFSEKFLPSTRSIAFSRGLWKRIGGFPEAKANIAEDTEFNYLAVKSGAKIARRKDAIVNWKVPQTFPEFILKIFIYAQWDAHSKIFWHPTQRFATHNLKILLVYFRYLLAGLMLLSATRFPSLLTILLVAILLYTARAFAKVYRETREWKAGVWGVLLQIAADIAVMAGFFIGLTKT